MKTSEQILNKMKRLSAYIDMECEVFNAIENHTQEELFEYERYMLPIIKELKVLQWVSGVRFNKFIKNRKFF